MCDDACIGELRKQCSREVRIFNLLTLFVHATSSDKVGMPLYRLVIMENIKSVLHIGPCRPWIP